MLSTMGYRRILLVAATVLLLLASAACEVTDVTLTCSIEGDTSRCVLTGGRTIEPHLDVLQRALEHSFEGEDLRYTVDNIFPLEGHALLVDIFEPTCILRDLTITYDLGPYEMVIDNSSIPSLPLPQDLTVLEGKVELKRTVHEGTLTVVVPLRRRQGRVLSSLFDIFLALYAAAIIIIIVVFSRSIEKQRETENTPRTTRKDFSYLLAMLTKDEETVLDTLLGSEGMTQRELRRTTGFSAPKLTRILAGLEGRSIIRREPVGRTKKVYLSGEVKYQKRGM
jgi:predicted transcriptional regulator